MVPQAALEEIVRTKGARLYREETVKMARELLSMRSAPADAPAELVVIVHESLHREMAAAALKVATEIGARAYLISNHGPETIVAAGYGLQPFMMKPLE